MTMSYRVVLPGICEDTEMKNAELKAAFQRKTGISNEIICQREQNQKTRKIKTDH